MANTAALISYPCFKDLEKSNINLVESVSHPKKSRKSRYDKKESSALKEILTCNRENSTTNTSRDRKKDVEILPTLVENAEKEEIPKTLNEMGKISDLPTIPTSSERKTISEGTDAIFSSYEDEARAKRRFSKNSLITYDEFKELQSSALLDSTMLEYNLKSTSTMTEGRTDLSLSTNRTANCKLKVSNGEPHMTLLLNANELKELHFDECSPSKPMKSNPNVLASKIEPNIGTHRARNWRIVLGVVWVISLIAAIIFVAMNNDATQSSRKHQVELVTLMPTNYEICLLVGRNFRRLIVSSLVNLLY
ncbi:uncharacterized protein LOC119067208 isoform X1 [Bradysia coprophila]|uniref:uncharacterized protein LOC119067208 isoform X1 n=1 Tax=Bradysia coprophila TaxID=38358 RepID=UPI00187D9018|nr:uncharacterized protein LOC119067208 isoform X1 [Bradysia coprophila]